MESQSGGGAAWRAGRRAVACAAGLAGLAVAVGALTGAARLPVFCLLAVAAAGVVVGARVIRASFERRWQERQLISFARELAEHVELDEVARRVLERGVQLARADTGALALHDPTGRTYRVEAVAGVLSDPAGWVAGFEVPEDLPFVQRVVAAGVLRLPEDDPASPVVGLLAQHAVRHALYVAMRHGGEAVGILGLVRRHATPFGADEQRVACALADQAALALRTARLVADLRRANKLKTEFVSTMSHELRTPLTVILGFAEMARDPNMAAAERDECLERLEAAGHDLLFLIEETLEIGKMEAGRDEVQLEPVALPTLWAELHEGCARMPRNAAVTLEWSPDAPAVSLVTDPRKLTVVVRNLVGNALKFTERGWVRVEARVDGDRVVVRVADTGIGIHPRDQAAVFEIFRQGDSSDSRRYGGTGLGLYIVRRFVEQLGGTVELESAPGQGSVFTVALPGASAAPPIQRAA